MHIGLSYYITPKATDMLVCRHIIECSNERIQKAFEIAILTY